MKTPKNTEGEVVRKVQDKAIIECYEYFARVLEKQGFVVDFGTFYGDGTRFPLLTRAGVSVVYESAIELWKECGAI